MKKLPIHDLLADIKHTLTQTNTLVLEAPPGAGKSTAVPISFLDEDWLGEKVIIMLEPRRLAARMVATFMAKLLGEEIGQRVGYQIKMERCVSSKTKIIVVTEAILVRMLQSDQELSNVAMVIFDEFHERSIHTDLSLALSLQVQELLREDLKLLIMSATLDSKEVSTLLDEVPVITSQGRMYEVEPIYLKANIKQPDSKTMNQLLSNTVLEAIKNNEGDILVFLAGVKEIKNLQTLLLDKLNTKTIDVLPLYSNLTKKEQDRAITKSHQRKIILSTNIAQTSLTIEGIRIVIDSGLEKLSRYNYATGMNHLELAFISKDSAVQRAGRAGRLSSGKCYRLWHQGKILQDSTKPEILRSDLSALLLDLALWEVEAFTELKWLDIPEPKVIEDTQEVLQELQMLDKGFKITAFGKEALSLGLHPRFSFMILKANELGYAYEACLLASLLSEKSILKQGQNQSDLLEMFLPLYTKEFNPNYINTFRAKEVLKQAQYFYTKLKSIKKLYTQKSDFNKEMIAVLLLLAYPDRLAKRRGKKENRYKLSNGKGAMIHSEDILANEELLVVANLNAQAKNSYITQALSLSKAFLYTYFSSYIQKQESITYNKEYNRFDIKEIEMFFALELSSKPIALNKDREMKGLLLGLLETQGLSLLSWNTKTKVLQERVAFFNYYSKEYQEENLPDISSEALKKELSWIEPYLEGIASIKALEQIDLYSLLLSKLTWEEQQKLDSFVPTHIPVPSGSKIKIDYQTIETPILAVKIQEVFGLHETPKVFNANIALQVHLLTPALRPIQITYDLKSFWDNSYDEVRKELRGKYKRHYWPENPYEAIATNKTKKRM